MRLAGPGSLALAAVVLTLVAGCTTGADEPSGSRPAPTSPAVEADPNRPSPGDAEPGDESATHAGGTADAARDELGPGAPPLPACYALDFDEVTQPTNDDAPVPCARLHTTQTFYVGRLDTGVDGHLLAVDSALAQRQVSSRCERRGRMHLGGNATARALSRLQVVWFSPTLEQSDEGATWFRCDVVLVGAPQELSPLPPPRRVKGILGREGSADEVGLCGTAEPGSPGFARVVCARPHSWKALGTIALAGNRSYPGRSRVRSAGESTCRDRVRRVSENPERFQYGWEWPTREQWQAGQRYGYCWAPD